MTATDPLVIRPANAGAIERMQAIEADAGERFRAIGLHTIADDEPPSAELLLRYVRTGTAWVAELDGEVVGYASASVVDDEGHLDQVSLIGAAAGRRIGQALIEAVIAWTAARGLPAVTLTTFRDVPWNGPYYERLGFVAVPEHEQGPQLAAIRAAERGAGLDVLPRIAMRRSLSPAERTEAAPLP
jgi:GNAT superfamily N-acetyltransferase